jgi:hypothetical protein
MVVCGKVFSDSQKYSSNPSELDHGGVKRNPPRMMETFQIGSGVADEKTLPGSNCRDIRAAPAVAIADLISGVRSASQRVRAAVEGCFAFKAKKYGRGSAVSRQP